MAKKHRRFGALHAQLKASGFTATSGPAGNYFNYLQGKSKLVVARRPDATQMQRFNVGVTPFDVEVPTGTGVNTAYQATMTVVADNIRTVFDSLTPDTLYGIQRDLTKTMEVIGFYSAIAHITVIPQGGTKTPKTSAITKNPYKAYASRSGGVPYGRSTSTLIKPAAGQALTLNTVTEKDCRIAILEALAGQTAGSFTCTGVTFTPEIHPEAGFFGHTKSTTAPTIIPGS